MKRIFRSILSTVLVLSVSLTTPQLSFARDVRNIQKDLAAITNLSEVDALSHWNNNSRTKKVLTSFIKAITGKNNPDFIPVKDRIAVFDFDGTLFCETDPNYSD